MSQLYDRADVYDLLENDPTRAVFVRKHWAMILENRNIQNLLDVSIGSGNLSLPLLDLGIRLSGSDLSSNMLEKCRKKAADKGNAINLRVCDFRKLDTEFHEQFDCVASTGNSLPYVSNHEVMDVLTQMDALVRPGGYLYIDLRNWDLILATKQRFYLYNPVFDGDVRINLTQAWDYFEDGTMDFNLLFTFEKDNRIFQKEIFTEHYYPISQAMILSKLKRMGYQNISVYRTPAHAGNFDIEKHDWYSIIAQKPTQE